MFRRYQSHYNNSLTVALQPYAIIHRNGIKIAVLGLTTPGIPKWLPKHLWEGMEFRDMIETARLWVSRIQTEEQPDLLIGLFHAGFDYEYGGEKATTPRNENARAPVVANCTL